METSETAFTRPLAATADTISTDDALHMGEDVIPDLDLQLQQFEEEYARFSAQECEAAEGEVPLSLQVSAVLIVVGRW